MAFPRKLLNDNEDLILDLRPHWIGLFGPTVAFGASIVLTIVVAGVLDEPPSPLLWLCAALLVGTASWFLLRLAGWATTQFVLTSDRIISRRGVLSKSGVDIPLDRVNTVFFDQRLIERLVGAGDLAIESASEQGTNKFENIRKPSVVQREIYVQIEANENRKFDRVGSAGARGGLSAAEQLEKLHALLQQGALTPEQYEAEKAKILGG